MENAEDRDRVFLEAIDYLVREVFKGNLPKDGAPFRITRWMVQQEVDMLVQLCDQSLSSTFRLCFVPVLSLLGLMDGAVTPTDLRAHASLPLPARIMALVSSHV